jgi:hypothetical protein
VVGQRLERCDLITARASLSCASPDALFTVINSLAAASARAAAVRGFSVDAVIGSTLDVDDGVASIDHDESSGTPALRAATASRAGVR